MIQQTNFNTNWDDQRIIWSLHEVRHLMIFLKTSNTIISILAGMIKESFHYYMRQDIIWFKRLF